MKHIEGIFMETIEETCWMDPVIGYLIEKNGAKLTNPGKKVKNNSTAIRNHQL